MVHWRHVEHVAGSGNRIKAEVRTGPGPILMLIPETWGNAQTRPPLVEKLDRDLMVVCVALAGQDDNWPPPRRPSISRFSEDVRDLANELDLQRFFVGGHSLGGMIAVDMLRFTPRRILGAIAIEGWTHWTVLRDAFRSDTSSTLNDTQQQYLQQVRAKLLDRWEPQLRAEYGTMWKHWDGWETLEATHIPVLEIWGDRGRPRPSRELMRIPDRKDIQLEWITGASHNLLIEAPERLAQLISGFVKAVSGSGFSDNHSPQKAR